MVFDGTDPNGWVFRAERFFDMNLMANDEKLEAAVLRKVRLSPGFNGKMVGAHFEGGKS